MYKQIINLNSVKTWLFLGIITVIAISCEEETEEDIFVPWPVDLISPETKACNQPLNVVLKWKNINTYKSSYTYDLYLGTSETDLKIIDTNRVHKSSSYESYECYGLELNTTYYWQVIAKIDGIETIDNELCEFTTIDKLPSIQFHNSTLIIYPHNYIYDNYNTMFYLRNDITGADSKTDGNYNTKKLVVDFDKYGDEGYYIAARQCYDLNAFGYDDWYLPAVDELDSICEKSNTLSENTVYWSSTEYSSINAYARDTKYESSRDYSKSHKLNFRCVRKEK